MHINFYFACFFHTTSCKNLYFINSKGRYFLNTFMWFNAVTTHIAITMDNDACNSAPTALANAAPVPYRILS